MMKENSIPLCILESLFLLRYQNLQELATKSKILFTEGFKSLASAEVLLLLKGLPSSLWRKKGPLKTNLVIPHIQFSSVAQSCPTLCDPMNRSTPGISVHHQLPEFTQIHVHRVSDVIQPSHPLSAPSPPAPNPSQHQSLFQ